MALATFMAAFVVLYPYLDATGFCVFGGATQSSHTASGGYSTTCLVAVISVSSVAFAFAALCKRHPTSRSRPVELYLAPDPHPPRSPR